MTQALPKCLSCFSLLLHLLSTCLGPLGEYEYTKPFRQDTADDDATWPDAQITLPRNIGTAIRAGLQATDGADIQIRLQCWGMFLRANVALTSEHRMRTANSSPLVSRWFLTGWSGSPSLLWPKSWTTTRVCRAATGPSAWHLHLPFAICEYERSLSQAHLSLWRCARALLEAVSIRRCPCP